MEFSGGIIFLIDFQHIQFPNICHISRISELVIVKDKCYMVSCKENSQENRLLFIFLSNYANSRWSFNSLVNFILLQKYQLTSKDISVPLVYNRVFYAHFEILYHDLMITILWLTGFDVQWLISESIFFYIWFDMKYS